MNERIVQTLRDLRAYALTKTGLDVAIYYHEEDSHLMRFANSAISLNTNEPVSYTHLRAHETVLDLVCRLLLEQKKNTRSNRITHS